jgi:hypothetical protein
MAADPGRQSELTCGTRVLQFFFLRYHAHSPLNQACARWGRKRTLDAFLDVTIRKGDLDRILRQRSLLCSTLGLHGLENLREDPTGR